MSDAPRIVYTPHPNTTMEAELNALANVYRYVLFDLKATRGGPRDLRNETTTEHVGKRTTEETERETS
jgi:hypothetical protein